MSRPRPTKEPKGGQPSAGARSGRELAGIVLLRVGLEGAWASRALDAELGRASLHPAEAARATDIAYGTLRALGGLDARLSRFCDRGLPSEPAVLWALRGAAYELVHTRAESHAVVDAWVGFVKRHRGVGLSRFANAVLRRLAGARGEVAPVVASFPAWMHDEARRVLGPARAESFFRHASGPAWLTLRARSEEQREALAVAVRQAHPEAEVREGALSPLAVTCRGVGDPRRLPGYDQGAFAVQDEGSQCIVLATGAAPGETVLDLCAGRGGKSLALADRVGKKGRVVAVDVADTKLVQLRREATRLGRGGALAAIETHAIDLSVGLGGLPEGSFDRVLLDAPCTGLGTLGRRPEIALRLTEADVGRMGELQRAIHERARRLLRPGGRLVYAVCSFAAAEVVGRSSVATLDVSAGPIAADDDGVFRIGPWCSDTPMDAYQVVVA